MLLDPRLDRLKLGKWEVHTTSETMIFPKGLMGRALGYIDVWKNSFPAEETLAQREFGVPSLIIGLDCAPKDDNLGLYEIEERPDGIGLSAIMDSGFRNRLIQAMFSWGERGRSPNVYAVISPRKGVSDDFIWTNTALDSKELDSGFVIVRAEPNEDDFFRFERSSISSVRQKGSRSYGVALGLWKEISLENLDSASWPKRFVLKPKQGGETHDILIWVDNTPNESNRKMKKMGTSTEHKIRHLLSIYGRMYIQEFIPPLLRGDGYVVYRLILTFNPSQKCFEPLGGYWVGRRNFKIHGTPDSVFGPLVLA